MYFFFKIKKIVYFEYMGILSALYVYTSCVCLVPEKVPEEGVRFLGTPVTDG